MGNPAGSFIWYELLTPDPDAAATFYAAVVGWHISESDPTRTDGKDYRVIGRADGGHAGGVLRITADMGEMRPTWLAYLSADDVDATTAAIAADGGAVYLPPTDIAHAGRIALVSDPQRVPLYVMTPTPPPGMPDATSDVFNRRALQRVNWNELTTPDLAASKAFYAKHFGFEFNETMNMGEMGDYCFIDHHGERVGAMLQGRDPEQPPGWLFYVGVPSATAARDAIDAHGGKVLMGPHQVPTGEFIVVATDPAGAAFGVVGAN
jgi:predicted enzyme related to lactoylglutathione lyase